MAQYTFLLSMIRTKTSSPGKLSLSNPLRSHQKCRPTDRYTAIWWLVHWPLMGGLLHLVQRGGAWAGCGPTESPPCCTKCNSPPINGQCTNFILFDVAKEGLCGQCGLVHSHRWRDAKVAGGASFHSIWGCPAERRGHCSIKCHPLKTIGLNPKKWWAPIKL